MTGERVPLSVAIIAKDEEEMLPECLKSVSFAEDIVVVDSGSTDRTTEIAKAFGCRVFVEDWKGFGPQKASAIEKCRYPWVLVIDADERLLAEAQEQIISVLRREPDVDAFTFPTKAFFNGRWIRHGGWWPDERVRLFRKSRGAVSCRFVHEKVEVRGTVRRLSGAVTNHPMRGMDAVIRKINLYSSLGAQELHKAGREASLATALVHAGASFAKNYVLKRGFLDGKEGLLIAVTGAITTFFKYVRLMELRISQDSRARTATTVEHADTRDVSSGAKPCAGDEGLRR